MVARVASICRDPPRGGQDRMQSDAVSDAIAVFQSDAKPIASDELNADAVAFVDAIA
jgi:hypothetical protein